MAYVELIIMSLYFLDTDVPHDSNCAAPLFPNLSHFSHHPFTSPSHSSLLLPSSHSIPSPAPRFPFTTDTNERPGKKGVLLLRKWTSALHHVFSG